MTQERSDPFGGAEPESLSPDDVSTDEIRTALSSADPVVRQRGARVCAAFATQEPSAVRPLVDDLLDRLDDESMAVTRHAATALVLLSDSYPDALVDDLEPVVELAGTELGGIRAYAARTLANVAVEHPGAPASYVDRIAAPIAESEGTYSAKDSGVDELEGISAGARQAFRRMDMEESHRRVAARATLAQVVVAAAEARPEVVAEHVDRLRPLLDDEDPTVVGAALDAYAEIAQVDADAVSGVVDDIADRLDHEDEVVRARAITALGYAGDASVVDRLRDVAEHDDEADVRDLAAETAAFLAN